MISVDCIMNALEHCKVRLSFFLYTLYKCKNDLLLFSFEITYHQDMHTYNTRSKCNIRKSAAKHKWGHWTTINFASDNWNELPQEVRQAKDLQTFKLLLN